MSPSTFPRSLRDGVPDWPRFPPNLFAVSFGLVGLAEVWRAAEKTLHTSGAVPDVISVVAAAVWAVLLVCYLLQGSRSAFADLRDRTFSPFPSLAPITGMVLAVLLSAHAFNAGRALVVVFLVLTLLMGGYLTGEWIVADLDHDSAHAGYFLPTVAGGFVGAFCASQVGLRGLAEASFGVGILCWIMIGSTIINRLFFHSSLPAPLVPTLAIELAPPVVGGLAYFAITDGRKDIVAYGFAGYAVLMVLVQLRLLPTFLKLKFSPSFWSFTFAWAAAATYALEWIALSDVSGARAWATVIVTVITLFIVVIAVKTLTLIRDGRFLPQRAATPAHLLQETPRP